jgi:hypothetical protein
MWPILRYFSSSFLGSTAQLRPWPPPQNPAEFLGGFSTIFFLQGRVASPTPNPHLGGPGLCIYIPRGRMATHFSRLLRHAWVTVGLFLFPGHHTGKIKILSECLSGGTWRSMKNLSRYPVWESDTGPPKYESGALTIISRHSVIRVLGEICYEDVNWIKMAEGRLEWRTHTTTVMNFRALWQQRINFTNCYGKESVTLPFPKTNINTYHSMWLFKQTRFGSSRPTTVMTDDDNNCYCAVSMWHVKP